MSKIDLAYDIVNGNPADASPVNANFTRIESHINTELIERDGSVQMNAPLKLSGNPVAALDAVAKQYVDALFPIGMIAMWGSSVAPAGGVWILANGASLSTAAYPELFAIYGYSFGGSGGNFSVPPLMTGNGLMPRGAAGTTSVGTTGGSADAALVTHTHPVAVVVAGVTSNGSDRSLNHNHTTSDHLHTAGTLTTTSNGRHAHYASGSSSVNVLGAAAGGTVLASGAGGPSIQYFGQTSTEPEHNHTLLNNTGGADRALGTDYRDLDHLHTIPGQTVNTTATAPGGAVSATNANLPPFVGLAYILRAK